ncbi:MAG: acyl-CoA-binding protein [Lysobacterales bacterium]|jgi:acyl-CoA-binding protein|nr:MAG: acyl-CoA-binding protein [Xanthomonadales bacterium]
MADLKKQFEAAAADVQKLTKRPDSEDMLRLYAQYKQATVGDVQGERPGALDFAGRAKYDAWAKLKGTGSTEAMESYVKLVERMKKTYG